MFSKCVIAFLLLLRVACAEGHAVEATLRFLVWDPEPFRGAYIDASQVQKKAQVNERVRLQTGGDFISIQLSSLRCSDRVSYRGDGEVLLFRGESRVARFTLSRSGEYYILLKPAGDKYVAYPVYLDVLKEGEILISNHARYPCALKLSGGQHCTIDPGGSKSVFGVNARGHTHHFTLHAWKGGKWKPEFARHYALQPSSKSLGVLYQDPEDTRVRLQFFSGL
jgi:hypothetical protein